MRLCTLGDQGSVHFLPHFNKSFWRLNRTQRKIFNKKITYRFCLHLKDNDFDPDL